MLTPSTDKETGMFKPTQHPLTYLHLTLLNYQIPEFPPLPYDPNYTLQGNVP